MRVCNTKAMKMIKELEAKKSLVIADEDENSIISYREDEEKISTGYDYNTTRKTLAEIDDEVRKIRVALAKTNYVTLVEVFNITIGEALILLAQLQNEKEQLEDIVRNRTQLSRRITSNGVIEYTECLFNVASVKKDIESLRTRISDLQVAIDRTNLINFIEI